MRACAIRRCRARRASAWPASAASGIVSPSPTTAGLVARRLAAWQRATTPAPSTAAGGELGAIESVLRGGTFWSIVGAFFLAGLLLSLTPCVLPMLPIVSSIIVGQAGHGAAFAGMPAGAGSGAVAPRGRPMSRRRGFGLAASYSFGMAVVYTAVRRRRRPGRRGPRRGACRTRGCSAPSRSAWWRCRCRCSASTTCRCRRRWPAGSPRLRRRCRRGRAAGVFAMGGVSALIVSPCVAAPLAGALLYLSQTRDVWLGGTALFSLADRHERAAAARRRIGRRAAAARRRLDGRGQGAVRAAAARRRALDRAAGAARRRWPWRSGVRSPSARRRW